MTYVARYLTSQKARALSNRTDELRRRLHRFGPTLARFPVITTLVVIDLVFRSQEFAL